MIGLVLYLLVLAALGFALPLGWWTSTSTGFLFAVGGIAVWRYLWGGIHLVRAEIYQKVVFPKWRRLADAAGQDAMPARVYLLMTSFRIDGETTLRVYQSAIREALASGLRVSIVASVVESADARLIKSLFLKLDTSARVDLLIVTLPGTGKRDAIAHALRAISATRPPPTAVVCVIDGDTILTEGSLVRLVPFFALDAEIDALTTDEVCAVEGGPLFREWYNLRFAQRQVLMCSLGLSRRVLTLTGRLSAFRARVACDPAFIARIESDSVNHWRLGRIRFLTGDDKSSWFHVLKTGKAMLYVPDVTVLTIERPPSPSFTGSAAVLMTRWFGNMLRTNGRALALGPRQMGLFTWWALLDQRASMWTSLIGPVAGVYLSLAVSPFALLAYLYWVALTRFVQTLGLMTVRQEASALWPFLLFFNQIFGAVMKTRVLFHLDQQKWTRQGTQSSQQGGKVMGRTSTAIHAASMLTFTALVIGMLGLMTLDWVAVLPGWVG